MLETAEGGIFESNAIARYVARVGGGSLLGSTPAEMVRAVAARAASRRAGGVR